MNISDVNISLEGDEFLQTYGGEGNVDQFQFNEYGITIGDLSIDKITPKQFLSLACQMINHLITNGHRFKIENTGHPDQPEEIKEI